jgi:hypothetical protein
MALSTTPTYPVAGSEVTLSITGASVTRWVFEITSVPSASDIDTGLLLIDIPDGATAPTSPLRAIELEYEADSFTPDVQGEYGITAHLYREIVGAPQFAGDPSGESRFIYGGTETASLHVGVYMDLPIETEDGHGATLRLQINQATVRDASIVEPTTEVARTAALDATVVAALTAIEGVAVASMGTDLQSGANDLLDNYGSHRVLIAGGVHGVADDYNEVPLEDADSQEGAILLLNEIRDRLVAHLTTYTDVSWHANIDLKNLPVARKATDIASATVLSADLRERCYEPHRVQIANPASHGLADGTNTLAAPTDLDDVITAYLDAIVVAVPAIPAGECQGAMEASHYYGFVVGEEED